MPKPFNGPWSYGLNSLEERPELAQHIGIIAGMWSVIESQLAKILTLILHTDAFVGATIYSVIRSERARLQAIETIAKDRLTETELHEYKRLQGRVRKVGDQRDALMHGLWAVPTEKSNSLVLLDSRANTMLWASVQAFHGNLPSHLEPHWKVSGAFIDAQTEYILQDFKDLELLIARLSLDLGLLAQSINERNRQQVLPDPLSKATSHLGSK